MEFRPSECKIIASIETWHKVLVFRSSEINNLRILVHGPLNQASIYFCLIRFTLTHIERYNDFRSDEWQKEGLSKFPVHTGVNLILDAGFKPMLKILNADKDYLTLFSIVIFAVESDSGVKESLEMVPWDKNGDFEA